MMFHLNRQTAKVNDAGVVNSGLRKEHAAATLSRTRGLARRHGATVEERLRQRLGISKRSDFVET